MRTHQAFGRRSGRRDIDMRDHRASMHAGVSAARRVHGCTSSPIVVRIARSRLALNARSIDPAAASP